MPELPEVETLRRALEPLLVGRRIASLEIRRPTFFRPAPGLSDRDALNRTIRAVRRRAKFLVVDLEGALSIVLHLRLAGQVVAIRDRAIVATGGHPIPAYGTPLPHKSTNLIATLDDRTVVYVTDVRQFGAAWLVPTDTVDSVVGEERLGVEPLDPRFSADELVARLRRHPRAKLKPLLLDQHVLAGLGNIYVDESLFAAGLHPNQTVDTLDPADFQRLHAAIRSIIELALSAGVAQIVNARAVPGAALPRIHGREGLPCPACGTPIVKFRLGGRGTYVCPSCQPGPAPDASGAEPEPAVVTDATGAESAPRLDTSQ